MKEQWIRANIAKTSLEKGNYQAEFLSKEVIEQVIQFHKSFQEYRTTPLRNLKNLAGFYGLRGIFVKDESLRFDLNAFKVLGGAYAIGKYLAKLLGKDISEVSFDSLRQPETKEQLGEITFVTATDGNHGRGVAWAARQLGQKSVVYMPKGSSEIRLKNIQKEGAEASIIDGNYEDAVKLSEEMAQKHGWVVVQDTAWEGYEDIPAWIMQGYATIAAEAQEQLCELGISKPTHIFLQAGVGSFAASILGYYVNEFKENMPKIYMVEPKDADCLYRSSLKGERVIVEGDMPTIMAGLACGAPNTIAYPLIEQYADGYFSCDDAVSARGMRVLGSPLKGDPQVVSGESGAVGAGLLTLLMERKECKDLRAELGLDEKSVVLLISTEGDTDPQKYKDIVWDGDYSSLAARM